MKYVLISLVGIAVATAFILQGFYTFSTGKKTTFLADWRTVHVTLGKARGAVSPKGVLGRLHGIVFLTAGFVVARLSMAAAVAEGSAIRPLVEWTLENLFGLLALLGLLIGLWTALRPRFFIESIGKDYDPPWSPTDPEIVLWVRIVALVFSVACVAFVFVWLRSSR